jgi:hypothetical protein
VDGIGHGLDAAHASQKACAIFNRSPGATPMELLQQCHNELCDTRGAVMAIASIHFAANRMDWLGVGNIDGVVFHVNDGRPREVLIGRNGTIGHQMPTTETRSINLTRGDVVVLATDGIGTGYADKIFPKYAPQQIANQVLEDFANKRDDALVLVVRYLGQLLT